MKNITIFKFPWYSSSNLIFLDSDARHSEVPTNQQAIALFHHPHIPSKAGRQGNDWNIIRERVTFGPPISPLLTTTLFRLHQINEININNNNGAACGQEIPPGAQDRLRVLRRHLPRDEHDHRRGGGDQIGKRQDETSTIALREQNLQNFARRT